MRYAMSPREFFDKVAEMRKQQKAFFSAKPGSAVRKDALILSKVFENEIDDEIARVLAIINKEAQP